MRQWEYVAAVVFVILAGNTLHGKEAVFQEVPEEVLLISPGSAEVIRTLPPWYGRALWPLPEIRKKRPNDNEVSP